MRIVWDHISKVPCLGSFILSDPLLLLITLSFVLAPNSYENSVQSKNGASKNVASVCGEQGNNTDCPCSHHVYGDVSESQRQFWIEEEYIIKGKVYKILVEAKKGGQCWRLWNPYPGLSVNGFLIPSFMDPQWLLHYAQSLTTTAVAGVIWPTVTTLITKTCRSDC